MKLFPDISTSPQYLYEMLPITIVELPLNKAVRVKLSSPYYFTDLIDDMFYPDFDGTVRIDVSELIKPLFAFHVPDVGLSTPILQPQSFTVLDLSVTGAGINALNKQIKVSAFSSDISGIMSDVDELDVPDDFLIPYSFRHGDSIVDEGKFVTLYGSQSFALEYEAGAPEASVTGMAKLYDVNVSRGAFWIEIGTVRSPVFHLKPGVYEQYLFRNRLGGFDNVPMRGTRDFVPEIVHETGEYMGAGKNIRAVVKNKYVQDTGYLTRKTIAVLSELLAGGQAYHLVDGIWRPIVIEGTDLSLVQADNLHSASFTYSYTNATRPII